MPQELRARLAEAAGRDGLSLNREIVRRLEQSLNEEAAHAAATNNRGRYMRRTRFRLVAAAAFVAAAVLAVAVLGARFSPQGTPAANRGPVDRELAPRLAQKLAA